MGLEIERKFHLPCIPDKLSVEAGEYIQQGYPVIEELAETRLRSIGSRYFITMKKGQGLQREEWETELDSAQFETLWPACGKRVLEKFRFPMQVGPWTAEIDLYLGQLKGLSVIEVEFPDTGSAMAFAPPPWFGEELTGKEAYTNHNLTKIRGKNLKKELTCLKELPMELGVIPYREAAFIHHSRQIMLVTTREGESWIFPKGQPELYMSRKETALLEAWEEGGIRGKIIGSSIEIPLLKNNNPVMMKYYPMLIEYSGKKWPEKQLRKRKFLNFSQTEGENNTIAVRIGLLYLQELLKRSETR